jgi:hypothetical protein
MQQQRATDMSKTHSADADVITLPHFQLRACLNAQIPIIQAVNLASWIIGDTKQNKLYSMLGKKCIKHQVMQDFKYFSPSILILCSTLMYWSLLHIHSTSYSKGMPH